MPNLLTRFRRTTAMTDTSLAIAQLAASSVTVVMLAVLIVLELKP